MRFIVRDNQKGRIGSVILPQRNEKHLLEDVPREAREGMTFHLVDSVNQVLDLALEEPIPRGNRVRESLLRAAN